MKSTCPTSPPQQARAAESPKPKTGIEMPAPRSSDDEKKTSSKGLEIILSVDDRVRSAHSVRELQHVVVNESRKITGARQIFLVQENSSGLFQVKAVSSLALVERDTPLIRWIEQMVVSLKTERGLLDQVDFDLPAFVDPKADETTSYPFRSLVWQPLKTSRGDLFAGLIYARERAWQSPELRVIKRQAGVYANAWQALSGARRLRPKQAIGKTFKYAASAALLLLAFVPVPLTALAPFEIVERNAGIVAAPIDGVIAKVLVKPNQNVTAGQPLLRFDDTTLRNRFEVADREMNVAKTKYDRALRAAFSDRESRHQLAITKSEYDLKKAERDYAFDLLARTVVSAPRSGILIYSDENKLVGRPAKTGERLMKIGAADEIQARIDLPVADSIMLESGAKVRLFLDAEPFDAHAATILSEAYHAEPNPSQQLVYKVNATLKDETFNPRIGSRGTAQIYGQNVPLIFSLLRKPISTFRQYFGF